MAKITTKAVIETVTLTLKADEVQALMALLTAKTRGNTMRAGGELGHMRNLLQAAGATGEGFNVQTVSGEIWVDKI